MNFKFNQLKAELKNVIVFIGLFIGTIIFYEIFSKVIKFPYRVEMFFASIAFLSESIFLFIGLMLLWKINLKSKIINIWKAILCCIVMTLVMSYIVNWIVASILYGVNNSISSLPIGLKYVFFMLSDFINFSAWLISYIFVCKFVFRLDGIYSKLKKFIIISEVVFFILSLICAFSDLIVSLTLERVMGRTGPNALLGIMNLFYISSKVDTGNLIIFVKCIIMTLIGIGLHRKFQG